LIIKNALLSLAKNEHPETEINYFQKQQSIQKKPEKKRAMKKTMQIA
jgi:hypothetical protein